MDKKIYFFFSLITSFFFFAGLSAASEDILKNADGYFKARNYIKAEELYREVFLSTKKGPLPERALFGIARTGYRLRRYSEARLNINRLITSYPQSLYLNEAYLMLGYISLYFNKTDEAQHYFEKAGGALGQKAEIGKAEVALALNNVLKAESLLSNIDKKMFETDPRALYVRAAIYSRKGMNKEALSTINKIMEPTLREEDLRPAKALIFFNAYKYKDAERICRDIINEPVSNPEKRKATKILAKVYEAEGKIDDALKLNIAIFPYEMDDEVKMNIVKLYDRQGDLGNALKYLSLLKDKSVKSSEIEKRLKNIVVSNNPKGLEYVQRFSGSINQDSHFIVDAARYLIANGKKNEGKTLLKKGLRGLAKGDASLYLSELLISDGKYSEAQKLLAPLMLENRYFSRASYLTAEILKREGEYGQAIQQLTKAVKFSKDYRISSMLADIYFESGDRANALKYYITASDKGDGESSVKAGDLFYMTGNTVRARFYYKRALSSDIVDDKNLQWAQYQYGKITRNKEYLKKAADRGGLIGEAAKITAGME